jgi:hypothetical protein
MTPADIFAEARRLIQAGDLPAARALLVTLPDNATALLWIAKIDERLPPVFPAPVPAAPPRQVASIRQAGVAYALPYLAFVVLAHGLAAVACLGSAYGGLLEVPMLIAVMAIFAFGLIVGFWALLIGLAAVIHRLTELTQRP